MRRYRTLGGPRPRWPRRSVPAEPSLQLDVEGVEVDVADLLKQLGGARVGQGVRADDRATLGTRPAERGAPRGRSADRAGLVFGRGRRLLLAIPCRRRLRGEPLRQRRAGAREWHALHDAVFSPIPSGLRGSWPWPRAPARSRRRRPRRRSGRRTWGTAGAASALVDISLTGPLLSSRMSDIAQAIADRQSEIDRLQAEIKALTDVEEMLGASARPASRSTSRRSSSRRKPPAAATAESR